MKVEQTEIEVIIYMQNSRVEGKLHLPSGGRLSDYMELAERQFVPVTDAKIYTVPTNELLYSVSFLSLNKDFIVFIFPKEHQIK
jgi:hypothetical protein